MAKRDDGEVQPLLALVGVGRSFPGVRALDDVSLALVAGRGHALVGENGAGKSTLVKIISGLLPPSSGQVLVDGQPTAFRSPADARRHGISLVPQELSLAADRSVAENLFMGQLPSAGPLVKSQTLLRDAQAALGRLAIDIDPASPLGRHPPAVQQLVMIARGIVSRGRLFILDEPTASLTDPEIERLFVVLRELKTSGAALLYVSHRLAELREIVEEVTVLRDGCVVDRLLAQEADEQTLIGSMIGRPIERLFDTNTENGSLGRTVLSVRGLSRQGAFEDISFDLRAGEIVGLSGLVGAGRTEVARALFGLDRSDYGSVEVDGVAVRLRSPRDAIAAGIVLAPEERKSQGLVLDRSISDNIVLPHLRELSVAGSFKESRLLDFSRRISRVVGVKAPGVTTKVGTLSGGNQQKVVLGRWLTDKPKVYILDEPTRGIDVQAKTEIYAQIGKLANAGAAILVISSELPEVLGICRRILVMRFGRLAGEIEAADASERSLLQLAMIDEFLIPPRDASKLRVTPFRLGEVAREAPPGPVGDPGRIYRIALLQADRDTAWGAAQRNTLLKAAAVHPNLVVDVYSSAGSAQLQAQTIDEVVVGRVDVIVVEPIEVALLTAAVERAHQRHVTVIGMSAHVASRTYDGWVWQDLPLVAAALAEELVARLNRRVPVVEVPGRTGSSTTALLHEGLARVLASHAWAPARATRGTDGSARDAEHAVRAFLATGQRRHAWFVHGVEAAKGVRAALSETGRADEIIVAVDEQDLVADAVRDGVLAAGAGMVPHGDLALRLVASRLNGNVTPKDIVLPRVPVISSRPGP